MAKQENRRGPKLPDSSNPTPKVEPGRFESIGPENTKNNVQESLKTPGKILGGAEGEKQKEDKAKEASAKEETTPGHILK